MDQLMHLHMMLGRLARGEHPYGTGPFDADHIMVFADDAKLLVRALDTLLSDTRGDT